MISKHEPPEQAIAPRVRVIEGYVHPDVEVGHAFVVKNGRRTYLRDACAPSRSVGPPKRATRLSAGTQADALGRELQEELAAQLVIIKRVLKAHDQLEGDA